MGGQGMIVTNHLDLPQTIVNAVADDPYSKGDADFSATELLTPPQIHRLERRYADQLEVDVADRVFALLGRAVHHILEENAPEDHVIEERLYRDIKVDGKTYTISGAIDVQAGKIIRDWKCTSVGKVMYGDGSEWERQLNVYQWLVREPRLLEIVAFFRDWKKSQVGKQPKYPARPVQKIALKSEPLEVTEQWIASRIRLLTAEVPQDCTPKDTWNGVRCKDWCNVAQFCPQVAGGMLF